MRENPSRISYNPPAVREQPQRRNTEPTIERSKSARVIHQNSERVGSVRRKSDRPISVLSSIFGLHRPAENFASERKYDESVKYPKAVPAPRPTVECLTCMSNINSSKAAKLACGHHMCFSCLRRIFNLSITDPQHMPPKCCTQDHIPLNHVEKLFDTGFKKKWNKKYQEYTTKNRIYCPSKGCGEWIKPSHIFPDTSTKPLGSRQFGRCKRCKTKVCCLCNFKWHASKECPNDEATQNFAAMAKEKGWQRCFNCQATVELKEGCNHMTCRCTAEFCMICGSKWKTCDCPWFNYATVEQDRLNHMNLPEAVHVAADPALGYQREMEIRREQERQDEILARRMHMLGIDEPVLDPPPDHRPDRDFWWRAANVLAQRFVPPDQAPIHIVGDAHGPQPVPGPPPTVPQEHIIPPVMAYQLPPTPPPPPHAPAPAPLRQPSTASRLYNNRQTIRPSERVLPRRTTTDYQTEAALHAPRLAHLQVPQRPMVDARRHSAMAGLTRGGSGASRVEQWRRHVS